MPRVCTDRRCLENECRNCLGLGRVLVWPPQDGQTSKTCPRCGGTGRRGITTPGVLPGHKEDGA